MVDERYFFLCAFWNNVIYKLERTEYDLFDLIITLVICKIEVLLGDSFLPRNSSIIVT